MSELCNTYLKVINKSYQAHLVYSFPTRRSLKFIEGYLIPQLLIAKMVINILIENFNLQVENITNVSVLQITVQNKRGKQNLYNL